MEDRFGPWIIRYSTGTLFSYHGFYSNAVKLAEESVKGTDTTYVVV